MGLKKPFYDALDLGTGSSVLGEPHKVKGLTAISVGEQQFLYVAEGKLRALDLSTGAEREIAKVDLKHDDSVEGIRVRESGYILQSRQNIVALDRDGKVRYHRDYKAPGGGLFSDLAVLTGYAVATPPRTDPEREAAKSMEHLAVVPRLADRLAAVLAAKDCACFYTDRPDSKGGSGFSLVRVDRETGEEWGRIWLDQRDPVYRIDHATGTVFVKSDREIIAYRF